METVLKGLIFGIVIIGAIVVASIDLFRHNNVPPQYEAHGNRRRRDNH